jgi:hypothetical protein
MLLRRAKRSWLLVGLLLPACAGEGPIEEGQDGVAHPPGSDAQAADLDSDLSVEEDDADEPTPPDSARDEGGTDGGVGPEIDATPDDDASNPDSGLVGSLDAEPSGAEAGLDADAGNDVSDADAGATTPDASNDGAGPDAADASDGDAGDGQTPDATLNCSPDDALDDPTLAEYARRRAPRA